MYSNNLLELYEVNSNSPKAQEVKQKLSSILKDSLNEPTKGNKNSVIPVDGHLADPNLEEAVISEYTETGQQTLVIPIDNGLDTRFKATVSGYNESANSIERTIVVTVEGNYTAAEIDANPELAEDAELEVTYQSETGEILFSHTYTSGNYNNMSGAKGVVTTSSCYWDCMMGGGYTFDGWTAAYVNTLITTTVGLATSSGPLGALAGATVVLGIHVGCGWGCFASWLWFG